MAIRRVTGFVLAILCVCSVFSNESSAQRFQRLLHPVQTPMRWLGEGIGPGYNHRNPGPNVDYYNPYSAHNSMLISRMPQYQMQYGNTFAQSRTFHQGIPFSVYAAPQGQYNSGNAYGAQGMSIESSFEPYDDDTEDETDADEDGEMDEDVDGEMDEDVDAFEDSKDADTAFQLRAPIISQPIPARPVSIKVDSIQTQKQSNLYNPFGQK